jgi:hypothetical protein
MQLILCVIVQNNHDRNNIRLDMGGPLEEGDIEDLGGTNITRDRSRDPSRSIRDCIGDYSMHVVEIVLEILWQHCSRRSQIVCYNVAIESPIQSTIRSLHTLL